MKQCFHNVKISGNKGQWFLRDKKQSESYDCPHITVLKVSRTGHREGEPKQSLVDSLNCGGRGESPGRQRQPKFSGQSSGEERELQKSAVSPENSINTDLCTYMGKLSEVEAKTPRRTEGSSTQGSYKCEGSASSH